jgi:hypothetical protein
MTDLVKYEITMQPLGSWIPCEEYEPGREMEPPHVAIDGCFHE